MDLDARAVEGDGFDANAGDLRFLNFFENPHQHAVFGPSVHSCVDSVPVSVALGEGPPFASVLGHIQNGVEEAQVVDGDIASLLRQAVGDQLELFRSYLHHVHKMAQQKQNVK